MKQILALILVASAAAGLAHAQPRSITPLGAGGKRVALVVGNQEYRYIAKLSNPLNDAQAVGAALTAAGFQVTLARNAGKESFEETINSFISQVAAGDVALFYYSGHATEIGGENYLSPVDLNALNEVQVRNRSIRASEILEQMQGKGAALQIVVLDACRDNPFPATRAIGGRGGLAPMSSGRGTLIAYATAPKQTADDNRAGRNGIYTEHLLAALSQRGLSLEQVFKQASSRVQRATNGRQIPWMASSVDGEFYFHDGPVVTAAPTVDVDVEMYAAVKDSKDPAQLDEAAAGMKRTDLAAVLRQRARVLRSIANTAPAPVVVQPPTQTQAASKINPRDGLKYVWIPPGSFRMGCSPGDAECNKTYETPINVTISKGFYLGESEVTQAAYQRVTGNNPSRFKGADLPVEQVSWNDAQAYCQQIGGRLPTEAEWEYAARGGSTAARYTDVDRAGWYDNNSGNKTHGVKDKAPNDFGLYDMLGNVMEWTNDWYAERLTGGTDPQGPSSGAYKVLRGGSWPVHSRHLRASYRNAWDPTDRYLAIGFRCGWE